MTFIGYYWNCKWYQEGTCRGPKNNRSVCDCEDFKDDFVPHHDRMKDTLAKEFFKLAIELGEPVLKRDAEEWAELLIRTMEGRKV